MEKLQLNTDKVMAELNRLGKNKKWLAGRMKATPAMVTYLFKYKPITFADRLARILQMDARDLIK